MKSRKREDNRVCALLGEKWSGKQGKETEINWGEKRKKNGNFGTKKKQKKKSFERRERTWRKLLSGKVRGRGRNYRETKRGGKKT